MAVEISLELTCAHCGGAVEVEFVEWNRRGRSAPVVWNCPYCDHRHELPILGRLSFVGKRRARPDDSGSLS